MDSPPKNRITNTYQKGPNDEQEQAMWDDFDGNFQFEPSEADLYKEKRKEFNRRMEEYGLWGGLEALPDDDMINIEHLWQEDEQDDILSKLLEHASTYDVYELFEHINSFNSDQTWRKGEKKQGVRLKAQIALGIHIHQNWHSCWTQ